jgi:hypothetical protein
MSILSQIVPLDADGLVSIDIPTGATTSLPHIPIAGAPVPPSGSGRVAVDTQSISRALLVGIGADDRAIAALEAGLDEYVR